LKHVALGVKCLIGLPQEVIEDRFRLREGEGTAFAIVGDVTHGVAGGGFLYTNKESISAGVVLRLDDLARSGRSSAEILDDFLAHPFTAPFVKGGKLLEYGAHLVPEGGLQMVPRLHTGGLLVAGDAAGFAINSGLVVRGMDLAIGSGRAAAQAVLQARQKGDFTAQGLSEYSSILKESFVMQDLKTYVRAPGFFENERLYTVYPQFVTGLMNRLFSFDGTPREHILPSVWRSLRDSKVPLTRLAVDGLEGVRVL
jgi:electron transfer flavoprotein-quinone oxidoreductase